MKAFLILSLYCVSNAQVDIEFFLSDIDLLTTNVVLKLQTLKFKIYCIVEEDIERINLFTNAVHCTRRRLLASWNQTADWFCSL